MNYKRWVVTVVCIAMLLSLFGCGKKHILDGPGMVNDQPWKAFTLSRSDAYAQYNFWFTVERGDFAFLLTGECRDEDGEEYTIDEGVELSAEDLRYLRDLWLGELADATEKTEDEPLLLDAPTVKLFLTWLDGSEQEKILPSDTSIEMYQRFLPYFQKN